jgi:hypothetical protein
VLLVPPLEQPTSPVLPAGVSTVTLKLPGAEIMEAAMVPLSWEPLFTAVATVAPLTTITEEETNWLPVAVSEKLGGNCEKVTVAGEIEFRVGAGRALPHRGFSALHPGRSRSTTTSALRRPIRREQGTTS